MTADHKPLTLKVRQSASLLPITLNLTEFTAEQLELAVSQLVYAAEQNPGSPQIVDLGTYEDGIPTLLAQVAVEELRSDFLDIVYTLSATLKGKLRLEFMSGREFIPASNTTEDDMWGTTYVLYSMFRPSDVSTVLSEHEIQKEDLT